MNIDLQSQIEFGDVDGLRDFFLVHRFVHEAYGVTIAAKGGPATPTAAVGSDVGLDAWSVAMLGEVEQQGPGLVDWLQLHQELHQAEYSALGFGLLPDLRDVDMTNEQQFYDWMYGHQQIHDLVGGALGIV